MAWAQFYLKLGICFGKSTCATDQDEVSASAKTHKSTNLSAPSTSFAKIWLISQDIANTVHGNTTNRGTEELTPQQQRPKTCKWMLLSYSWHPLPLAAVFQYLIWLYRVYLWNMHSQQLIHWLSLDTQQNMNGNALRQHKIQPTSVMGLWKYQFQYMQSSIPTWMKPILSHWLLSQCLKPNDTVQTNTAKGWTVHFCLWLCAHACLHMSWLSMSALLPSRAAGFGHSVSGVKTVTKPAKRSQIATKLRPWNHTTIYGSQSQSFSVLSRHISSGKC